MKSLTRTLSLLAFVFLTAGAPRVVDAAEPSATDVFSLDTLTLDAARAADSTRKAAEAATNTATANANADTARADAAALEGTRAGRGSLSGRVASEARGTVVAGARVIVAGKNLSTETDADGRFGFADLEPGTYSLFVYHGSYAPLTVDGLEVVAARDVSRRLPLPDKALQGEAVRITGAVGKAGEAGLLFAQKNAPSVSDGISAQQISKTPDGDAAAALKRVTGISIGGDGLVYVRGLGERYVNMQLNGMTVSSPNPEKRVVPLDMFPTRLLENLTVSKTFTADQPAEFAGGSLQLRTRDYPDKRLIEFSATGTYEPGSTFEQYLTYKGGKLDLFGIDDGTRAIPDIVPSEYFDDETTNMGTNSAERKARQRAIMDAFPNVWTPYGTTAPLNQSYGLTMGNKIPLGGDNILGWLLGGSYSAKWSLDEEFVARVTLADTGVRYQDRVTNEISKETIQWGVLGTASWQDGIRHKIRLNALVNREWEDEVKRVFGRRESDNDTSLLFELSNAQQTLLNAQLEGEHQINDGGTKLSWVSAVTGAKRWEPDRRVSKYLLMRPDDSLYNPAFPYFIGVTGGLQDRYWFELKERGGGGKVEIESPIEYGIVSDKSRLKGGLFAFGKSRSYEVRRITYDGQGALPLFGDKYGNRYEDYFDLFDGTYAGGYVTNGGEKDKDNYKVDDFQWAAHGQTDLVFSDAWRAILGLRFIHANVEGRAESPSSQLSPAERDQAVCRGTICAFEFGYNEMALLPSVSLIHGLTESQNLRASWTRTFAFPEYREMAPLLFYSYEDAVETVGNTDLKPTDINNYDFRWEWFPSLSELLALSVFYKQFDNPVELRIQEATSNLRADYTNAPSASLIGLEGEVRAGFERIHDVLTPFQFVANYTWIRSEVEGRRKRTLQGQSPYLLNLILFYEIFDGGTQMSLLYNEFGRRLAKVGAGSFPDVYEESRSSLEYAWTQKLGKGFKSKFTARNLTSPASVQTQGGLITRRVKTVPTYSLGVTYAF